jgi:hypothetical protein
MMLLQAGTLRISSSQIQQRIVAQAERVALAKLGHFDNAKGEKFPRGFSVFYQGSAVLDRLPGFVQGCGQNTDVVRVEDAPCGCFFRW